jgi:hypothetical protein
VAWGRSGGEGVGGVVADAIGVAPAVALRLGGVNEVTEQLWPIRCQTCGSEFSAPTGGARASRSGLVVEDAGVFAVASLHHPSCRPSAWEPATQDTSPWSGRYLTCRTRTLLLPLTGAGMAPLTPIILVNPSLEQVVLGSGQDHRRTVTLARFHALGMRGPGQERVQLEPLPDTRASLVNHSMSIQLGTPGRDTWRTELSAPVKEAIQAQGRFLVGVTHAVDPHAVRTADQLGPVLLSGRVLLGWVLLD